MNTTENSFQLCDQTSLWNDGKWHNVINQSENIENEVEDCSQKYICKNFDAERK